MRFFIACIANVVYKLCLPLQSALLLQKTLIEILNQTLCNQLISYLSKKKLAAFRRLFPAYWIAAELSLSVRLGMGCEIMMLCEVLRVVCCGVGCCMCYSNDDDNHNVGCVVGCGIGFCAMYCVMCCEPLRDVVCIVVCIVVCTVVCIVVCTVV